MLLAIDAVLHKEEVRQIRQRIDAAQWQDGAATAGALARSQKSNQQLDDNDPVAVAIGDDIVRRVSSHPQFVSAALPKKIYPPKFNRYAGGGTYGAHVDSALMFTARGNVTVRSDLAATLFLSEPENYDGGELQIESEFGMQSVKLPAGDLILYPASSLHRVTPVTRGARISAFFWVESFVADVTERTLLYDLDQSIQGLTPRVEAGDQDMLQLTGVYHNLLRRWATT